eukprot:gene14056-19995_t
MSCQWWIDAMKRTSGEPSKGRVTIVVTEVEDYARLVGLASTPPDSVIKSLNLYGNVIRKASWSNFAHIIEHDRGSFVLIFQEAVDAAAFCLQVQQSLMRQAWPEDLYKEHDNAKSSKRFKKAKGSLIGWARGRSLRLRKFTSKNGTQGSMMMEAFVTMPDIGSHGSLDTEQDSVDGHNPEGIRSQTPSQMSALPPPTERSSTNSISQATRSSRTGTYTTEQSKISRIGSQRPSYNMASSFSFNQSDKLLSGLKIRMGMASGVLQNKDATGSMVLKSAESG